MVWWTKIAGVPASRTTLICAGRETFIRHEVAVRPWFAGSIGLCLANQRTSSLTAPIRQQGKTCVLHDEYI